VNLSVALHMFEVAYNALADVHEQLVDLAESKLPVNGREQG